MKLKDLTQQQKQIGIAVAALILLIVAVAFSQSRRGPAETESAVATDETSTTTPTSVPQGPQPVAKPGIGAQETLDQAEAYAVALKQYAGRVIQFNRTCQASPAKVTFKSGTAVLFDNRSDKPITMRLDENPFTIKAYDYLTMKVTSKVLPKTISIDCNSSYNVGQILLQQ